MGKYKQWLHHQEVGRRLREQIATHEQERERVQRMAPSHPTTLPDTNNPLIRALLDYTGRGGTLGRALGTRISGTPAPAGASAGDADPHQRQPVTPAAPPVNRASATTTGVAAPQASAALPQPASDDPVLAQLTALAAQTPADPIEAMRALAQSQARDAQPTQPTPAVQGPSSPAKPTTPEGNTTGQWWQNFRKDS